MVSIRWVAEALGANVEWDEDSRAVWINNLAVAQRLRSLEPEQPQRNRR
ncbi:MAG: copper amine oxidase N-terminal domain-containing protein [Peptococcaceae bacterium]|nr:copper amine oxidase N-terminal domain-containing protein [Peptococcaceae bacterium]